MRRRKIAGVLASAVTAAALISIPARAALQLPAQAVAPGQIEAKLAAELQAAKPGQSIEVLVGATSAGAAEAAIKQVGLDPFLTFEKVGFSSTSGPVEAIRRLATQPGVTYVQGNRKLQTTMNSAPTATRIAEAEAAFASQAGGAKLDGSGVGVAVVDSGMAGDHEMFTDANGKTRLLNIKQLCVNLFSCGATAGDEPDEYFINATGLDTDVTALGGHGTHVTAIAGGKGVTTANGVKLRGVATNSSLYGLGAGAGIFTINAAASLNWVLEHHAAPCKPFAVPPADVAGGCAPIKVVNNSYGSPGEYDPADFYAVISEKLVAEGVTVVWAAGNGDDVTATNPRPNDGSVNLTNPPGQSPVQGVLMVANYDDGGIGTRDGLLNPSSSRGRYGRPATYPDLAAPGTNILAACRPWLPICSSTTEDPNYGSISGTSMAAPHVAGVVALLLQANPSLTPGQIEDILEDTAYQFTAGGPYEADPRNPDHKTSFDKGHGLVDVNGAVRRAMSQPFTQAVAPQVVVCSGPQVLVDTAGDAQPGMDVTKALMGWDGTTFTTVLSVEELAETYPQGNTGRSYFVDFKIAGVPYFITAGESLSQLNVFEAAIGRPEGNIRAQKVSDGMTATLNVEDGTITITMTQATIDALNAELATEADFKPLPALSATTFNNIASVTYTETGVGVSLLTEHDVASSGCGFVVGSGAITEPPPPRYVEPAPAPTTTTATLRDGQAWDGQATAKEDSNGGAPGVEGYRCTGADDPLCDTFRIEVVPGAAGSTLSIWLDPAIDQVVLDDWDLRIFDPSGAELEWTVTGGVQTVEETVGHSIDVTAPGIYTVLVQPFWVAKGATVGVHAEVNAA